MSITLKVTQAGPDITLKVERPETSRVLRVVPPLPDIKLKLTSSQGLIVLRRIPQPTVVLKYMRGQASAGATSTSLIVGEVPLGAINGSNATFTSLNDFVPLSVDVRRNGLSLKRGDEFNTSGHRTITLMLSPIVGDVLTINYQEN